MRAIVKADIHGNLRISFFRDVTECDAACENNSDIRNKLRNYEYESFARSKRTVIDYGMNNDWDYFVTITFDGKKVDRYNAQRVLQKLQDALKDYRRYYDSNFAYVLVPELHDDGAIHWHGLFKIGRTDLIERHWDYEKHCIYYRIDLFYRRLGRFRLDKVATTPTYVAAYITKYMTKANERIFQRRYICSKGLNKGTVIFDSTGDDAGELYYYMETARDFDGKRIEPVVRKDFVTIYAIDTTTLNLILSK